MRNFSLLIRKRFLIVKCSSSYMKRLTNVVMHKLLEKHNCRNNSKKQNLKGYIEITVRFYHVSRSIISLVKMFNKKSHKKDK